jgi:hypothetical protein
MAAFPAGEESRLDARIAEFTYRRGVVIDLAALFAPSYRFN